MNEKKNGFLVKLKFLTCAFHGTPRINSFFFYIKKRIQLNFVNHLMLIFIQLRFISAKR